MACRFIESFRFLSPTSPAPRWGDAWTGSGTGRYDEVAFYIQGTASVPYRDLGVNAVTVFIGFAYKRENDIGTGNILRLQDGTVNHVVLRHNVDGTMSILRGTTVLDTSDLSESFGVGDGWHYVEIKATIDNAAGVIVLKVDGVEWLSFSGDTQNAASAQVNRVTFLDGSNNGRLWFDDIYMFDSTGGINNDFAGDCRVVGAVPNGAGYYTDFTPLTGANYENVDETGAHDGDSSYNYASVSGYIDSFVKGSLGGTGVLKAVQLSCAADKDDAGSRQVALGVRISGVDYFGTGQALGDGYSIFHHTLDQDPSAGPGAWTLANYNNTEIAYKVEV